MSKIWTKVEKVNMHPPLPPKEIQRLGPMDILYIPLKSFTLSKISCGNKYTFIYYLFKSIT
jgi:hypothetical protein